MDEYYADQAGNGISYFQGQRFQRGNGFFGNFFRGSVMPLLKKVLPYLGRQAVETGSDFVEGLRGGQDFKQAARGSLKKRAGAITEDALTRIKGQIGSGRRRSRTKVAVKRSKKRVVRKKAVKGRRKKPTRTKFDLF
jgi:hypothetical protein